MFRFFKKLSLFLPLILFFPGATCNESFYLVEGRVTFDYVPALDSTETGSTVKLDFASKIRKPARRIVVQTLSGKRVTGSGITDDGGYFSFYSGEKKVKIFALAKMKETSYVKDKVAPGNCNRNSWNFYVVDNTNSQALYAISTGEVKIEKGKKFSLHAALSNPSSSVIKDRISAPFAILDTVLNEVDFICSSYSSQKFPPLSINWSPLNTTVQGFYSDGDIGNSHYTVLGGDPHLFILGHADVDTDEYDDHIIAHEFAHYVEDNIYRSDSPGGSHAVYDSLDPRVAFSEGYANAVSAMVFQDPVYVDTSGIGSASGFEFDVRTASSAYSSDLKTIFSEFNVQNFLWVLYDRRDSVVNTSGLFDRIDATLRQIALRPAATTLQSFAAYYNQLYGGSAENLQTLWASTGNDYNSLCSGACSGISDIADLYDTDNDLGIKYNGASVKYPPVTGSVRTSVWWRFYKPLTPGSILTDSLVFAGGSAASSHVGGTGFPFNKFGANRLYFFTGNGSQVTVKADTVSGAPCTGSFSDQELDLVIWYKNIPVAYDITKTDTDCPKVSFSSVNGRIYTVSVYLQESYTITSPQNIYILVQ